MERVSNSFGAPASEARSASRGQNSSARSNSIPQMPRRARQDDSRVEQAEAAADPFQVLELTENGLYCTAGDFYIDPWGPVDRAVITHAHADHARPGSKRYLTGQAGERLLQARL